MASWLNLILIDIENEYVATHGDIEVDGSVLALEKLGEAEVAADVMSTSIV
jgi:hypothetical protein